MQTTLTTKTTSELSRLNTSICNAMERAARVGNVPVMQSLLRDRRAVRTELERRKGASTN
jgi:hypothetical protein